MVDVQTISIAIASASVVAAATYYFFHIRNQTRLRQTDLVMRLYSMLCSKELQGEYNKIMADKETTTYNKMVEKYGEVYLESIPETFFEGVGVLLHRKLIDIGLVDDLMSGPIKMFWERRKPVIEDARKQLNYPQYAEFFEYLYNEMKKREQKLQNGVMNV